MDLIPFLGPAGALRAAGATCVQIRDVKMRTRLPMTVRYLMQPMARKHNRTILAPDIGDIAGRRSIIASGLTVSDGSGCHEQRHSGEQEISNGTRATCNELLSFKNLNSAMVFSRAAWGVESPRSHQDFCYRGSRQSIEGLLAGAPCAARVSQFRYLDRPPPLAQRALPMKNESD